MKYDSTSMKSGSCNGYESLATSARRKRSRSAKALAVVWLVGVGEDDQERNEVREVFKEYEEHLTG
ncbi:uncharacterized protein MEPE_04000 [Melanopsichium pennsylvanicum]|uniref:Uncharacterized protein n=1 Tax=Melanopsichium pennsylvanicum TaxID=63383 RepID=A0AAJ5C606_9BASI|nr:uncharacterized protein MEPE_04000 [Melanopsichium pennsylvanicum]